jgi:hypothetical protein
MDPAQTFVYDLMLDHFWRRQTRLQPFKVNVSLTCDLRCYILPELQKDLFHVRPIQQPIELARLDILDFLQPCSQPATNTIHYQIKDTDPDMLDIMETMIDWVEDVRICRFNLTPRKEWAVECDAERLALHTRHLLALIFLNPEFYERREDLFQSPFEIKFVVPDNHSIRVQQSYQTLTVEGRIQVEVTLKIHGPRHILDCVDEAVRQRLGLIHDPQFDLPTYELIDHKT